MKKVIDTSLVQYKKFDPKDPFDTAYSICDWLDGNDPVEIARIVDELRSRNLLNDFGQEVYMALELFRGMRATNKGVPKKTLDFYKKYDEWRKKNKINDPIKDLGWGQ